MFQSNRTTVMSHSSNFNTEENQPLHYFTGRVRAFWKGLVFFSDARNVAVIDIHDVFLYGKQASPRDLAYLEELVRKSDWKGSPEFHSYVSEYPCDSPPPWPYQLSGKRLWKARCAWFGLIPNPIRHANLNNIVHMPISYYTGTVLEFYDDKILFGDMRNSVIVSSDNFYVKGERGFNKKIHGQLANSSNVIIHAYIIRLEVLTDTRRGGPEPDLPPWPKEDFSSDMWVAKYAWYGEMPDAVRGQVGRYYVIRMNQWGNMQNVPWKTGSGWQDYHTEKSSKEKFSLKDNQRAFEKAEPFQSLVPTGQRAGFMRGTLLMADDDQGLMTSYADLIVFNKDNFFINGQKFKDNYDLSIFFQTRRGPLSAWVMPFDKPKVIFNINVVWHAVCVWYGSPPKEMEYIRKGACGKFSDNLRETTMPVSLTHFVGSVHSLSFASGVLMSKIGLDQPVKISFKRKAIYLHGSKFHSSCSLLDKQHILENNSWSVLAYPLRVDQASGIPHYQALVVWHYDDQHCMNMLFDIISEFVDEIWIHLTEKKKLGQHMSGCIKKVTEDYGIIQVENASVDATYLYFRKEVLYVDGELYPRNVSLQSVERGKQYCAQAKTILPKKIDGYEVTKEATLVWSGRKPSLGSSGEFTPADCPGSPLHVTNCDDDEEYCNAKMEIEFHSKPNKVLHAAEGVMMGSVFVVDERHGLIICSNIIAGFSSDTFFVNGDKFSNKYGSLNEFCSDRKITVRAMIVSLKNPKVLFNCLVMCESVCVWIGQEPKDLKLLQKAHLSEKKKTLDISEVSDKSLLYFKGRMIRASKDVTLLASTTPEGTSKIIFSKEHFFINGTAVHQDDLFEQCKSSSQSWSVLALPMSPKDLVGHSVCYTAVAVWDMNHHHKMRKVISSLCQPNKLPVKQEQCTNRKLNGLSKRTPDTPEALLHTLQLGDSSKEERLVQVKASSQLNDPSVIVSHITKELPGDNITAVDSAHSVSIKEFCGKHITGYIVKKFRGGGVAQWKSQLFEGYVFIEFSIESLYLDLGPVDEKWKVSDVQSRPCNFYVIPIPHHSVGEYIVSLKATCGWMGKKPSHLPSPGTQLLPKIDLSSVHVTQPADTQDNELKMGEVEAPQQCYQNGNIVNETVTSKDPVSLGSPQPFTATKGKIKGNTTQEIQSREATKINHNMQNQAPPSERHNVDKNKCGKIWEDKNRKKDHHCGTIVEVHSSVGQLKGVDGSLHYFPRESCYLYGVPLCNVELWHVLAQDDPVLYTLMELVPGMMKVQRVWLGALELPNNKTATDHILDWCQMKLVPDGARDILISQLEQQ